MLGHKPLFLKLFLLLVLTGCVSVPQRQETDQFQILGKISVRDTQDHFSSRFSWIQTEIGYQIELWGPLGQGRTRLHGDDKLLTITDSAGKVQVEGPPAEVMRTNLGWELPLEVLPQWMLGRPADGHQVEGRNFDEEGVLVEFYQLGWHVLYDRFSQGEGPARPGRIDAVRGEYRIRLIVSQWQI